MGKRNSYAIQPTSAGFNVVHRGPTVVAKDLKWIEAEALAKALNAEERKRVDQD